MAAIACPPECVYLEPNVEYQQKRIGEHFEHDRQIFYRELLAFGGEKAAEAFYFLEVITFKYFHHRHDGQDGEIIAAVQALRHSFSPLHVPDTMLPAFAETLKKEYTALLDGRDIDTQVINEVLDRGLQFIKRFSGENFRSNRFLSGLTGFLKSRHPDVAEQLMQLRSDSHILLPSGTKFEG
ncbi:MAG: hypothetical protein D6704_13085 [Nitrospirae bacterium]|nr:MAG: hypothetical protein D6704_13085 [Nitrospirota bacterium]